MPLRKDRKIRETKLQIKKTAPKMLNRQMHPLETKVHQIVKIQRGMEKKTQPQVMHQNLGEIMKITGIAAKPKAIQRPKRAEVRQAPMIRQMTGWKRRLK